MKLKDTTRKIISDTQTKLGITNVMKTPRLEKVIVAIGIGSLATRKGMKDFSEITGNLHAITGQKPVQILSKKSISNFKLRENMPSMLKVTLRKQKAYDFLFKTAKMVMTRVRDFNGFSEKSFDQQGSYTIGMKTYSIFPELHPDNISTDIGLQITIQTTSSSKKDTRVLLESIGFMFK